MFYRFLILFFFSIPLASQAQYVLLTGHAGGGLVDLWNLDEKGVLSKRSSFDIWTSTTAFADPRNILPSRTGKYVFISEFDAYNGVIYCISEDYGMHVVLELTDGCGGGGFTPDEKYFFTNTNMTSTQNGPRMSVFRLNDDAPATQTFSEIVPTTAGLTNNYLCTSRGEVISTGANGYLQSPNSLVRYAFSPTSQTLIFKQYIPEVGMYHSDLNSNEDLAICTALDYLALVERLSNGTWVERPGFVKAGWLPWSGQGVRFSPDEQHVLVALRSTYTGERASGGMGVLRVMPDKTLQLHQHLYRNMLYAMAMTPDGKFIVAPYEGDKHPQKLGVFRYDPASATLTEVYTISRDGYLSGMAFLPQAYPPAAAKAEWPQYSEKKEKKHSFLPRTLAAMP